MHRSLRHVVLGVGTALLCAAAPAAAQSAAASQIAAGEKLFAKSCQICHGEAGVGNRAPALRGSRLTVDYVSQAIVEGKAGTMMPRFGSAFTPDQVAQLARYVMSLQRPDSIWAALRGDAASGERLFFDEGQPHSCQGCHTFQDRGRRVGPDLTARLKGKSPREIFEKIVIVPHRSADPAYLTVEFTMRNGERLKGIQAESDGETMRIYDTSVLPPVVRTLAKADVQTITRSTRSAMPSDYASRLPLQHLLDLVAFLRSGVAGEAVTVSFADVMNRSSSNR